MSTFSTAFLSHDAYLVTIASFYKNMSIYVFPFCLSNIPTRFLHITLKGIPYANYFLPQTVRSWNLLPDSTKNCPSINVFKSQLNLNIIYDKPTFFYIGSCLGQTFHARIRMGCSALISDICI
jgi:hypothetical protein